jgi:hypothetical protein
MCVSRCATVFDSIRYFPICNGVGSECARAREGPLYIQEFLDVVRISRVHDYV